MHTLLQAAPADPATKSVFISYSRADLGLVRALTLALRRSGLRTWMDLDDLRPGQRWKDAIGSALEAADAMVFCLSALSLESLPGPSRCPVPGVRGETGPWDLLPPPGRGRAGVGVEGRHGVNAELPSQACSACPRPCATCRCTT